MKYNKVATALMLACGAFSQTILADEILDDSIETIVVTGQKIDRSLKETVNSVAVVTAKEFEKLNIKTVDDIYNIVPNISGDFGQGFSIRGIDGFNVSGGGNSYLTSIYLDGAPLPERVARAGGTSVWDLAQVEVFRGPQSTLQGRNALAGAIIMRTQDPTYEWTGKGKLAIGEYGKQEVAFAGGGALVDDILAFRLSYEDNQYDGDIYNTTQKKDQTFENTESLRGKLLFQPTEAITALLTLSSMEIEYGAQWAQFNYGDSAFDRKSFFNSPIWQKTDADLYNLELTWELTDELSLYSVTTYNDSEYSFRWDGDLSAEQLVADQTYIRNDETISQDLRITYQTDDIQALFGVYYSKLEVDAASVGERLISFSTIGLPPLAVLLGAPPALGGFGLPAELIGAVLPLYPDIDPVRLGLVDGFDQEVETMAIYADITWHITDQFDLLAGLRYDEEEQSNSSRAVVQINNTLPDPAVLPAPLNQVVAGINANLNGIAAGASGVEPLSSADFDAWLPKIGVSYHASEDVTASLVYQRGYRSGGVGTNTARTRLFTYDPEYTDNYELSIRSVWLGGNLMWNTNLFYTDWTDQQISIQLSTNTFDNETINSGESNVKGFETEVYYYPSEQLTITAGLGYAKSEFTEFEYTLPATGEVVDLSERSFADAPEWTANIAIHYDFGEGFSAGVNANYRNESPAYLNPAVSLSSQKLALNADPTNDARTLVNVNTSYEWDNYTIRLDVSNLLDKDYISTHFTDADNAGNSQSFGQHIPGRSRQVSLTFLADF
ncbi:TonB-dependent receptor [Thalassotalea euphylliae]|uniref:TonB-dependent receptor n=1 Tax=Thalassotalea euphylliae TaxID=1655234 RepID=A0A3E0TR87_9GAMM|nr:TonB-dependent receptor [Thalassotalea euphylliae]REL26512.1 TonB-dependent receptor [Thalassotalea euphylliae]